MADLCDDKSCVSRDVPSSCGVSCDDSPSCAAGAGGDTDSFGLASKLSLVDYPSSDDESDIGMDVIADVKTSEVSPAREHVDSVLDKAMAVLYRMNLALERCNRQKLVAFNIAPLLRLLRRCEDLYENTEDLTT